MVVSEGSDFQHEGRLPVDSGQDRAESFTHDLAAIAEHATGKTMSVAEIEAVLQGRGFATLCLILCIPFIQPIPLPGLSVAFGCAIMALGLRLAFGTAGGLPEFVKRRELDTQTLHRIIQGASKVFSYVERLFKPRLGVMLRPPLLNFIGVSIILSGLALSLPLPPVILFSNSFPAWSIILLSLGYLERDGLVIVIGHVVAVATWCYFAIWWEAVRLGIESLILQLQ
jgi:hypothetical protein